MKIYLLLVVLTITSQITAQRDPTVREPTELPTIEVTHSRDPRETPDRGQNSGSREPRGGELSAPVKDASPVTVKTKDGKVTISQKTANNATTLVKEYTSPPTCIFPDYFNDQLADRLKDLAGEALRDNRKADANFLNDLADDIKNKKVLDYEFNYPKTKNLFWSISPPIVVHNVYMQNGNKIDTGMKIIVPGLF